MAAFYFVSVLLLISIVPSGGLRITEKNAGEDKFFDKLFDVYGNSDIRLVDSLAHRSALVIGLDFIQRLRNEEYDTIYIQENDEECKNIFKHGNTCILHNPTDGPLPFPTMSVDLIIIHKRHNNYLQDVQRLLGPLGTLIIQGEDSTVHSLDLMQATKEYINVYKRNFVPGESFSYGSLTLPKGYEPPSAGLRYQHIVNESDISLARLKWWDVSSVLNLNSGKKMWADNFGSGSTSHMFIDAYVGKTMEDGSRAMIHKRDWPHEYEAMIREGKIKSVVDAGAGACSVSLLLRKKNLMQKINYLPFGFYDESMSRICAERGELIMDWSWLNKIPVCSECKYDLVFQVEGLHHMGQQCREKNTIECATPFWQKTMDNFDAVTKCGGLIHVGDHPCYEEDYFSDGDKRKCWKDFAVEWANGKGYETDVRAPSQSHSRVTVKITKKCAGL